MKKNVLTFILVITLAFVSRAQSGIKAGFNFSNLDISGQVFQGETSNYAAPFIGVFTETNFTENTILRFELMYAKRGAEIKIVGENLDYELSYVELPVLLRFKTNIGVNFNLGPSASYLIDANATNNNGEELNLKDVVKTFDTALNLGVGYVAKFGLEFEARYYLGLSNISDDGSDAQIKNQGIQLSVGYRFN